MGIAIACEHRDPAVTAIAVDDGIRSRSRSACFAWAGTLLQQLTGYIERASLLSVRNPLGEAAETAELGRSI